MANQVQSFTVVDQVPWFVLPNARSSASNSTRFRSDSANLNPVWHSSIISISPNCQITQRYPIHQSHLHSTRLLPPPRWIQVREKRIRAANLCSSRRSPGIPNPFEPSMPQFQGSCISPTVISHHLTLDSSLNQLKIKVVNDCDSVRFCPRLVKSWTWALIAAFEWYIHLGPTTGPNSAYGLPRGYRTYSTWPSKQSRFFFAFAVTQC